MELVYEFDQNGAMTDAHFEGLDGCEQVSSVKEALSLMKIRNPAVSFSEGAKAGVYNDVPDEEYQPMFQAVKCVSSLWRYKDAPEGSPNQLEMNALMLLANAVELVSRLNAQLRG